MKKYIYLIVLLFFTYIFGKAIIYKNDSNTKQENCVCLVDNDEHVHIEHDDWPVKNNGPDYIVSYDYHIIGILTTHNNIHKDYLYYRILHKGVGQMIGSCKSYSYCSHQNNLLYYSDLLVTRGPDTVINFGNRRYGQIHYIPKC